MIAADSVMILCPECNNIKPYGEMSPWQLLQPGMIGITTTGNCSMYIYDIQKHSQQSQVHDVMIQTKLPEVIFWSCLPGSTTCTWWLFWALQNSSISLRRSVWSLYRLHALQIGSRYLELHVGCSLSPKNSLMGAFSLLGVPIWGGTLYTI